MECRCPLSASFAEDKLAVQPVLLTTGDVNLANADCRRRSVADRFMAVFYNGQRRDKKEFLGLSCGTGAVYANKLGGKRSYNRYYTANKNFG